MTTTELIKQLAQRLNISQKDAKKLLYQELGLISEHLSLDKNIIIRGFGTFGLREARQNSSSRNVFFRPSGKLKEFIKPWRPE